MNRLVLGAVTALVMAASLSACGSESESPTAETVTTPSSAAVRSTTTSRAVIEDAAVEASTATSSSTSTRPSVAPEVEPETVAQSAKPVVTSMPMPAVVCMNLQAAQDLIQDLGVFYSRSVDATGKGRNQVLDANWIVVGQTPGVGTPISEGDAVLSVVKIGEPNPC